MKLNYNDPETQSKYLTSENIEQLKKLFPNIVEEGKVNFDVLRQLLGDEVVSEQEYYRFTWPGKHQARQEALKRSTGTLRPAKEESVDWDSTENLYIEGDNLEVLKLLQKSYFNKVKMIYIDPPYNTGKDFVYKDNYKDNLAEYNEKFNRTDAQGNVLSSETNNEGNARYHSNWLNMMYPRLQLARTLLKDDGVIFISIDDNEVHNLRRICDEIFGEENFINQFIWKNGRTSSAIYTKEQEYILSYAKNLNSLELIKYSGPDDIISDRAIKKIGKKNPASEINFPSGIRFESKDKVFPKEFGGTEKVTVIKGRLEAKNGELANDVTLKAGWVMKDMIEDWIKGNDVFDSKGQNVTEFYFKDNGVLQYVKQKATIHPKTIIEGISTKSGTNEVTNLMGFKAFDYPKPIKLLNFLQLISEKDSLILDFFSGSGSTAHSVMNLNAQDNGNRRCISVQLPEPTEEGSEVYNKGYKTISEIGKERIRRAANQIKEELKDQPEVLEKLDLGFKVFKLDSSNIHTWDTAPEELENNLFRDEVIKENRTAEDVLYEVLLKYGLDLTYPIEEVTLDNKKVYSVGAGQLIFCLDDGITRNTAQAIIDLAKEDEIINPKVVFKDAGFTNDVEKTNLIQLFKTHGVTDVKSI